MRATPRWLVLVAAAAQLYAPAAFSQPAASVEEVSVERIKGETFFLARVKWPSQGVPSDAGEFFQRFDPQKNRPFQTLWPIAALALVPQSPNAWLVVRETATGDNNPDLSEWALLQELPNPATFLGKVKGTGKVEFLLRHPAEDGKFRTSPLSIDFSKAKSAAQLKKRWTAAQANFFRLLQSPPDISFPAFAHQILINRLGKDAKNVLRWNRRGGVLPGLYEISTGAMALQESLQLDRLRETRPDDGPRTIAVDSIVGVSIKPHPWDKMLAEKNPKIEPIAALVPQEQYYLRFRSVKALRAFLDYADQWGGLMLSEVELGGRDYGSREKIERQLCLRISWMSELLGEAVIESVVLTGSDPYLREGTDVSLVFRLKSESMFFAAVNRYLDEARRSNADLKEAKSKYQNVEIDSFTTADSTVRAFRARLGEYAVYSNSPVAIRRIIDANLGRRPSIAEAKDFRFMRTLYPLDDPAEDGFLFLSDSFLRHLTGPRLRIAEKRRLEAVTAMELVKNAALFYLWENPGAPVPNLEQLYAKRLADKAALALEPGDKIFWDTKKFAASTSRYGRVGYLTPNIEIELDKVTLQEKHDYENFRSNYESYWRQYFDPIGIRITARQNMALALTVLPLIDNSEYNRIKEDIGGKAVELEPIFRGKQVIFHLAFHLNPESRDIRQLQTFTINLLGSESRAGIEWLGERAEFWMEDSPEMKKILDMDIAPEERGCLLLSSPMVAAVEIKNALAMTAFLVAMRTMVEKSAPNMVRFESSEKYKEHSFTIVRPGSETEVNQACRDIYFAYGAIGKMFYLSTSLPALHRVVDQVDENTSESAHSLFGAAKSGHLAGRLNFPPSKSLHEMLGMELTRRALQAEIEHLHNLWLAAQLGGFGEGARLSPAQIFGYSIASSLGGRFQYHPGRDEVISSVAGSLWEPKTVKQPPAGSPLEKLLGEIQSLRGSLEFTEHGLHTELSINRKP